MVYKQLNISYTKMIAMMIFIIFAMSKCLASKSQLRIYGGLDAKPGEYPYVVRIENQRIVNFTKNNTVIARHTHKCSGSALSPVWVISAAHCAPHPRQIGAVASHRRNRMVIRYGHVEKSPWFKDTFSEIKETIIHPLYVQHTNSENHDLLLIKTTPMKIKSFLKVSAVDYKTLHGQEAILAGFGFTPETASDGKDRIGSTLNLKKPLQVVTVMIFKCASYKVPSLCAVPSCGEVSAACPGDSGGPLIHPSGLIGVISKGRVTGFCGFIANKIRPSEASNNVAVSPYIEWILSYVNAIQ